MSKNVVLIDSDSLCFLGKTTDTLQQIIEKVDYKIQAILDETNADYYCLFVSQGKYFRHALKDSSEESGSYKSNRKYSNQNYNRVIKEYLIAQYSAVSSSLAEADDLIAYWMNMPISVNIAGDNFYLNGVEGHVNKIMAAVDKDLLKSIPGKHLNYNKKQGDEWGMEWIETSVEESHKFYREQLLMGDSSDGVIAFKGVGPVKAEKLISTWTEGHVESHILSLYIEYYKGDVPKAIYEFQKNYRLLHLLDTDECWLREVGYTPELPSFKQVIKQNVEIKNEF